jgi:hypothetical protein
MMVSRLFFRHLKYRGGYAIPMFQLSVRCEKCVAAQHYADIGKQLLFANNRKGVRGAVLGLSHDGPELICLKISV